MYGSGSVPEANFKAQPNERKYICVRAIDKRVRLNALCIRASYAVVVRRKTILIKLNIIIIICVRVFLFSSIISSY